ncbi:hypothetical protein HGRIS_004955 [Hohenbuehelia grisea]
MPTVVTPYYAKGALWNHILRHRNSSLSPEQISERLGWTLEIARAIEYLHGFDPPIIHSDLRCANIFLDDDGHVRVAEYGFVAATPTQAVAEHVWAPRPEGHAHYRWMAPEFYSLGHPPDHLDPPLGYTTAADVWAFGMTVLELFTARSPYGQDVTDAKGTHPQAKADWDVPKLADEGVLPPLSGFLQGNPVLRVLLRRCWAKDPSNRPSMAEVCRALETMDETELLKNEPPPVIVESFFSIVLRIINPFSKLRSMLAFLYSLFRLPY